MHDLFGKCSKNIKCKVNWCSSSSSTPNYPMHANQSSYLNLYNSSCWNANTHKKKNETIGHETNDNGDDDDDKIWTTIIIVPTCVLSHITYFSSMFGFLCYAWIQAQFYWEPASIWDFLFPFFTSSFLCTKWWCIILLHRSQSRECECDGTSRVDAVYKCLYMCHMTWFCR